MKFRASAKILLCLLILIGSLTTFANWVSGQSIAVTDDIICEGISDAQEMVRRLKDYEFLKQLDQVKDQRISNLEKENELLRRESELKDRIIAIKDMEIAAQKRAFEDMKEISDRSLKLAEISKPKSNLETYGLGILAAIIVGILLVK